MTQTLINHKKYQSHAKDLTDAELRYTIQDCTEAIDAMPNGHKAGYYQDEINYCSVELSNREKKLTSKSHKHVNGVMSEASAIMRARVTLQEPLLNELSGDALEAHKTYLAQVWDAIILIETNENEWSIK